MKVNILLNKQQVKEKTKLETFKIFDTNGYRNTTYQNFGGEKQS